jgi:hypothetical protein
MRIRTYPPDLFTPRQDTGPERAKAESVLDVMAHERLEWLLRVRGALAELYETRVAMFGAYDPRAYVCADDADRLSQTRRGLALPAGASPNVMGAVFRCAEWQAIDRTHVSSQEGSHGNLLTRWRYVGHQRDTA